MKVFVSWSGETSHQIAIYIGKFIEKVLPIYSPWISSIDLSAGKLWFQELSGQLVSNMPGILCITPENLRSPWIYFEAGVLSKNLDKKTLVCPYLFQIHKNEIKDLPLQQFQYSTADLIGTKKLILALNSRLLKGKINENDLTSAIEKEWPNLHHQLQSIPKSFPIHQSNLSQLSNKGDIQSMLETIMEKRSFRPLKIYQTLINNLPIAADSDILHKIENKDDCDITRIIAISNPLDIYFATKSIQLSDSNFTSLNVIIFDFPQISSLMPTFPNFTVIDNYSIVSLPMDTGTIFDPSKLISSYFGKDTASKQRGKASGIYFEDENVSSVLSNYISKLGINVTSYLIDEKIEGMEVIEKTKIRFWGATGIERAEYLFYVAIAIKQEIIWNIALKDHVFYIGIVGSVARIFETKDDQKNIDVPGDIDIVILCDSMKDSYVIKINEIVTDVCSIYSIITNDAGAKKILLKLLPQFSSSPAKISNSDLEVPVQILIQDINSITTKWMPYIYLDRHKWHIDLLGDFDKIPKFGKFSMRDVINGNDGILECIQALKARKSPGYKWTTSCGIVAAEDDSIELDNDEKLFDYMYYSLHWAIINLSRASDSAFKLESERELNKSFSKIASLKQYMNNNILWYILEKQYRVDIKYNIDECKIETINFLTYLNSIIPN